MKSVFAVVLTILVTAAEARVCPTGCSCTDDQKTMICRSLDAIPEDVDPVFTDFIFDNCDFAGELSKMPASYNHALMLQIIHSNVESVASGAFEDMTELTMLSLRGNQLRAIDSSKLVGLSNLVTIDLQGNQITEIEDELFKHNPNINKVIFSDNPITTIKDRAFAQPEDDPDRESQIEYIELENCNLNTIPTAALCMSSMVPNLVSLDLSRNNFSVLEENLFAHLSKVEQLELDSCHMSKVTRGTFAGLKMLKSIRLSYNKLSSIEEGSFEEVFATLNYIHLDYNQLTVLPYGLFNWGAVKVLNISNNPWECSCSNGWIQEYNIAANDTNYNVR